MSYVCDLIGSAEQQDVCETQMPLSTAKKVQFAGLFSKSVALQAETLGLVLLWKNYIYKEMGLDGPVLLTVWELLENISTRK